MRLTLQIGGTTAAILLYVAVVLALLDHPDNTTGWWILGSTVALAAYVLDLWWPDRKEHDRDQPR